MTEKRAMYGASEWYNHVKWLYHLMLLNVLFLLTAWPLVTIGAASTALYRVLYLSTHEGEEISVKGYFREFSQHFRKSTALWIIWCLGLFSFWWMAQMILIWQPIVALLILPIMVQWVMIGMVLFALVARFSLSLKDSFIQGWFFANRHLPWLLLGMVVFSALGAISLAMPALQLFLVISLCHMLTHWAVGHLLKG